MRSLHLASLLLFLAAMPPLSVGVRSASAQDDPPSPPRSAEPRQVRILRGDGQVIEGQLLEQSGAGFTVRTTDGQIFVPFTETRRIESWPSDEDRPATEPAPIEEKAIAVPDRPRTVDEPPPETQLGSAAGRWIVLELTRGDSISGSLLFENSQLLQVLVGEEELQIPRSEIRRFVTGSIDRAEHTADSPPPPPGPAAATTAARSKDLSALLRSPSAYFQMPGYADYRAARLALVNSGDDFVGPPSLGYDRRDFGRYDRRPFRAVRGQSPLIPLSLPGFLDLAGSVEQVKRWDARMAKAEARQIGGILLLVTGIALNVTAALAIGGGQASGDPNLSVAGGQAVGWGIGSGLGGGLLLSRALKEQQRLRGDDLSRLMWRDEAWDALQTYNHELRARFDLPEDPILDAPEPEQE